MAMRSDHDIADCRADDRAVVREGLRSLLSAVDGYELVDTAATGAAVVRSAVILQPDVVVMDIQMPDMTGIEATREIRRVALNVRVLMLTMFDDDESVPRQTVRTSGPPIASRAAKSLSCVTTGIRCAAAMAAIHKSLTFIARPTSASRTLSSAHLAAASRSTGNESRWLIELSVASRRPRVNVSFATRTPT